MKPIETQSQSTKNFDVQEGSNYKVTFKDKTYQIIDFGQFQKLAQAMFVQNAVFTTVNKVIVQIVEIKKIEPTDELTQEQIANLVEEKNKINKTYDAEMEKLNFISDLKEKHEKEMEAWYAKDKALKQLNLVNGGVKLP